MSYIHDALKASTRQRSERQADRGGSPDAVPAEPAQAVSGKTFGRVLLVLILLLLGVWLWQGQNAKQAITKADDRTDTDPPVAAAAPPQDVSATDKVSAFKGVRIELGAPAADSAGATRGQNRNLTPQQTPAVTTESASVEEPVGEARSISTDPFEGLPYLRQLPASQQRELQGLRFSVHIYAEDPASRLVKYEGRVMREQDFVRPGLRVISIIPRAVVMQYQDTRFKVPAL